MTKTNREVPDGIQLRPHQKLCDLDYADDICLLSHSLTAIKRKLDRLATNAAAVGLKINLSKTKLMRIATDNNPLQVNIGNSMTTIEDVDKFCYLGSMLTKDGGTEADIDNRLNKARHAYHKMRKVWSSRSLSKKTKLRIFNTSIKPILLYGCETWKIAPRSSQKLQVFINKCLRYICRIFWPNVISNERLFDITNSTPINTEIRRRKWSWIGHTLRKDDDDITKMALTWNPQGSRRPGRPKNTWMRTVQKESQNVETWLQIRRLAQDRDRWKAVISALCSE